MTGLRIEAPTDAQLDYIAVLCDTRGHEPPPAVHSRQEASEIITAIQLGQYFSEYYAPTGRRYVPEDLVPDYDPDDVPF